jgi:hypothetical protein
MGHGQLLSTLVGAVVRAIFHEISHQRKAAAPGGIRTSPPIAIETGWNATQATLVVEDGQAKMVISAVFNGELQTDCNVTIPLGPGLSPAAVR